MSKPRRVTLTAEDRRVLVEDLVDQHVHENSRATSVCQNAHRELKSMTGFKAELRTMHKLSEQDRKDLRAAYRRSLRDHISSFCSRAHGGDDDIEDDGWASSVSGLGDAAARRRRKLPKTTEEIRRAFERFPAAWDRGDMEAVALRENLRTGGWDRYRERILSSSIRPGKAGRCVYFLTKAENMGQGLPEDARDKPYTLTSLCMGGKKLHGGRRYASQDAAQAGVDSAAAHERARGGW